VPTPFPSIAVHTLHVNNFRQQHGIIIMVHVCNQWLHTTQASLTAPLAVLLLCSWRRMAPSPPLSC
jgi:hypothetical protein